MKSCLLSVNFDLFSLSDQFVELLKVCEEKEKSEDDDRVLI